MMTDTVTSISNTMYSASRSVPTSLGRFFFNLRSPCGKGYVMFSVKSAQVRDMHIETHSALNFFQHNFLVPEGQWC